MHQLFDKIKTVTETNMGFKFISSTLEELEPYYKGYNSILNKYERARKERENADWTEFYVNIIDFLRKFKRYRLILKLSLAPLLVFKIKLMSRS